MPAPSGPWPLGTASSGIRSLAADMLAECLRHGITHLELDLFAHGADLATDQGVDVLAAAARDVRTAGMVLWSVHLPYGGRWDISVLDPGPRAWAVARQYELLAAAAGWGAGVAVVHGSAEPITPGERPERLRTAAESLGELAARAAGAGIRLAVECLPRTCLGNTAAEMRQLLAAAGPLTTCCDVNHLFHEAPADYIRALARRLATLHLSDNDGVDERHWLPGQGIIDWAAVGSALEAAGYAGPLMFEVSGRTPADFAAAGAMLRRGGSRA